MTVVQVLSRLQDSPPLLLLRGANHLVIEVTEVAHVLGLVSFLAALLLVNLRLLGFGLRRQSIGEVARAAAPPLWTGLGLTLLTGTILFLSGPVRYYMNSAFQPKMALLALALLVQLVLYRRVVRTDVTSGAVARSIGTASLLLWFGVGLCGRAIGYV
jgi:fucose 4-O-acetylase-like acetyltransferase